MKTEAEIELEQIAEAVRPRRSLNDENDAATIARVFAENAKLRKDKERLDWIQSRLHGAHTDLCHYVSSSSLDGEAAQKYDPAKPYYVDGQDGWCGETLRDAIDAAMRGANTQDVERRGQ